MRGQAWGLQGMNKQEYTGEKLSANNDNNHYMSGIQVMPLPPRLLFYVKQRAHTIFTTGKNSNENRKSTQETKYVLCESWKKFSRSLSSRYVNKYPSQYIENSQRIA